MATISKRLAKLESRKPATDWWRDPFPVAMRLWEDLQAVAAGKACLIPRYGPDKWSDESAAALAIREVDRMSERLRAEKPTPS